MKGQLQMEEVVGIFAILGALIAIPLIIGGASIANGIALTYLWAWFISEPFGAPLLSTAHAIGISTLISFITYQYTPTPKETKDQGAMFFAILVRPLIAFLFGWIVHNFM
jgi:hypothetical protein